MSTRSWERFFPLTAAALVGGLLYGIHLLARPTVGGYEPPTRSESLLVQVDRLIAKYGIFWVAATFAGCYMVVRYREHRREPPDPDERDWSARK